MDVDYNFDSKKISKKNLENKDPKWGHGTSIGFYIGFKGTFVLDYNSMMPVLFVIHPGSPHDSQIFPEILEQMKKNTTYYAIMIKYLLIEDIIVMKIMK